MSAAVNYSYSGDGRPAIPGATWVDGVPGPAPNTPRPGLPPARCVYIPAVVTRRREYVDIEDGWTKYETRRTIQNRKKGYITPQNRSYQAPSL